MTSTILNYLNNQIKLSKIIENIEKDFSNGYLFAELLHKVGYLKIDISFFKKETESNKEIKENFLNLKDQLYEIGIHLDEWTINSIISCKKNIASNLIYKIRTKINRKKICFDDIMNKINLHNKEEKNKNNNYNNKYSSMKNFYRPNKKLFPDFHKISNNTLFYLDSFNKNKTNNNFFSYDSKKENENNNIQNIQNLSLNKKLKLKIKPIKKNNSISELGFTKKDIIKLGENQMNINIKNFSTKNHLKSPLENINEIYEKEYEQKPNKVIFNHKSKNIIDKKEDKNNNLNFNKINEENEYMKFSNFENNTLKIGFDLKKLDLKLKKYITRNNNDIIPTKVILSRLKEKLKEKEEEEEEKKNKKEDKKILNEDEKIFKHPFLKSERNIENKSFIVKFDNTKQLYKMKEYEKKRKLKFPIKSKKLIQEMNSNKKIMRNFIIDDSRDLIFKFNGNSAKNLNHFKVDFLPINYFDELDKKSIMENNKNEINQFKKEGDILNIIEIVNLIIDMSEECYKYQKEKKTEFINLPEYKNLIQLFINGKTCLKPYDITNKLINDDKINVNNVNDIKNKNNKESSNIEKRKNEIEKSELCSNELIDYLFNRGNWNNKLYVPNTYYGKQLHIYDILGNDISNIISSGKIILHGIKQSSYLQMKNEEFELKEEEKNNILIPKENKRNQIFGEIIELNYDNISNNNNFLNNNLIDPNLSSLMINNDSNNYKKNNSEYNFSHIPIKICLMGSSFSGRKTQAKILCNKYPGLKIYSINNIVKFYSDEYERLYINNENNNIKNKNNKKSQIDLIKEKEEEIKKFDEIKDLIEDYALKKVNDLSDEIKLKLLLREINKDFPYKDEKIIYDEIQKRNSKKKEIEIEIEKNKEELDKKNKIKANLNIQQLENELECLNKESYVGFILVDYPNNYEQHLNLEEYLSGFIQEIDKSSDKRDLFLNYLTNIVDKPYYNISYLYPEVINFLGHENQCKKSIFNYYIWLYVDEQNIINRLKDRLIDPQTGIIYEMENNPPNQNDKKLIERLIPVTEPSPEQIKEEIKKYNLSIPKIIEFLSNFKNLHIISKNDKFEINKEIENEIIINIIKKFEDRENKDKMGDLIKFYDQDENIAVKYFKRLNETKKKVRKEISNNIIENWIEFKEKYSLNIKEFIFNFNQLKNDIISKMSNIQDKFIDFLNSPSQKKKMIDMFLKKYDIFIENYYSIKNHSLVKEEIEKDIIELTENLWKLIQSRKNDAINELNSIINNGFIEKKLNYFWEILSNLFLIETEFFIKKVNIIREFYFEFDINKYSDKNPYEYILKKDEIIKDTNNLPIYVKPKDENKKSKIKDENNIYIISPRIDKIYKNCFKILFIYDNEMNEIEEKEKENFISNISELSNLSNVKRRKTKKIILDGKKENSIFSDGKSLINQEGEIKASLSDEKIKYKLKLVLIKYFGEKFIEEINNITKKTFENMDKWIVKSVDNQNNAMNKIINRIKESLLNSSNSTFLEINKTLLSEELDFFNIYEKYLTNFKEFNLKNYKLIKEEDKIFDTNELYKIYLDLKIFEIQENYVTLNSLIDILFKKHLFDYNSKGFMNCFKELPYHYLNKFINKFIIKTIKGQNLIRIDQLFTVLLLINIPFPNREDISSIKKQVDNKIKYICFLSKKDFLECNFWFDKKENTINKNNLKFNSNKFLRMASLKQNKNSNKSSSFLDKISLNSNNFNSINEKKNFKEILFEINKNYNDEINFLEFIDNITLKFIKIVKKKKSSIKIKNRGSYNKNMIEMRNSQILSENKKDIRNRGSYNKNMMKMRNSQIFSENKKDIENKEINFKSKKENIIEQKFDIIKDNLNEINIKTKKNINDIKKNKRHSLINKINDDVKEKTIDNDFIECSYFEKIIKDK